MNVYQKYFLQAAVSHGKSQKNIPVKFNSFMFLIIFEEHNNIGYNNRTILNYTTRAKPVQIMNLNRVNRLCTSEKNLRNR